MLDLEERWIGESHIDWRRERLSVRRMSPKGNGYNAVCQQRCRILKKGGLGNSTSIGERNDCQQGRRPLKEKIVRSYIGWEGEPNILSRAWHIHLFLAAKVDAQFLLRISSNRWWAVHNRPHQHHHHQLPLLYLKALSNVSAWKDLAAPATASPEPRRHWEVGNSQELEDWSCFYAWWNRTENEIPSASTAVRRTELFSDPSILCIGPQRPRDSRR